MRIVLLVAVVVLLAGCGPEPAPAPPPDATKEAWYRDDVSQLVGMNRQALESFQGGKPDDASALIVRGETIASQLLGVLRPTLEAMEAASDLDDLYGRMLLSNRHYEWAQFQFQKNVARWKYWKPQTADTAHRLEIAEAAVAECERGMMNPYKGKAARNRLKKATGNGK